MICKNCGCENKNENIICDVCGKTLSSKEHLKTIKGTKKEIKPATEKEEKRLFRIIISIIVVVSLAFIIGTVYFYNEYIRESDDVSSFSQFYKSDDELILGSWKMDTSKYGEGLNADLNRRIVKVTFYSDGTCVVDGWHNSENGSWDIVDGNLRVQGNMGGMFWSYKGFISPYSLSEDKLIIYEDDGVTISDIYYKDYD